MYSEMQGVIDWCTSKLGEFKIGIEVLKKDLRRYDGSCTQIILIRIVNLY